MKDAGSMPIKSRQHERRDPATAAELAPAQRAKVERVMELVFAADPAAEEGGDHTAFLYDEGGLPH